MNSFGVTPPMGIYDRDYYRNEGPSFLDSIWPTGLVCRWLIAINVAVFLLQILTAPRGDVGLNSRSPLDGWVTSWFILDTDAVLRGQVWRLLTFAFLHYSFTHIFFNMLFLWWFGSDLEQLYGRAEFLLIYLLSAFCGGVVYVFWSWTQGMHSYCMGASGAVTMLLVLCALHFPQRTILVFMFLPLPIWVLAVLNVAQDTYVLIHQCQHRRRRGRASDGSGLRGGLLQNADQPGELLQRSVALAVSALARTSQNFRSRAAKRRARGRLRAGFARGDG